ncbi:MAG: GNAT family N-acetyltransferase [Solirubrobacteraceae bacterium]
MHRIREAGAEDRWFLVEMARLACTLEDRRLPGLDTPEVRACLPLMVSAAVIATDDRDRSLGAAWWHLHEPPLLAASDGSPLPELTMAVIDGARGRGIGTALIEALAGNTARQFEALVLNVHLRNPAARLYTRSGFQVAGKGRGPFGVAMIRELHD